MIANSEISKFKETIQFLSHLGEHAKHRLPNDMIELDASMELLRAWQSQRLERTYADFLSSPRFGPACRFFLTDIYAPRDFSQRDHDIEYLYGVMKRFLPDFLLGLVRNAIEMNALTNTLDHQLLAALVVDLDVRDTITPELYAEAYRICDNYEARKHQIELIIEVGRKVEKGTHLPLVGTALRLARGPANRYGWHELHDFLDRGFNAFKRMHGSREFLGAIQEREMRILDRIFANHPDPFGD